MTVSVVERAVEIHPSPRAARERILSSASRSVIVVPEAW